MTTADKRRHEPDRQAVLLPRHVLEGQPKVKGDCAGARATGEAFGASSHPTFGIDPETMTPWAAWDEADETGVIRHYTAEVLPRALGLQVAMVNDEGPLAARQALADSLPPTGEVLSYVNVGSRKKQRADKPRGKRTAPSQKRRPRRSQGRVFKSSRWRSQGSNLGCRWRPVYSRLSGRRSPPPGALWVSYLRPCGLAAARQPGWPAGSGFASPFPPPLRSWPGTVTDSRCRAQRVSPILTAVLTG